MTETLVRSTVHTPARRPQPGPRPLATSGGHVRLTRRGRVVLVLVAAALVLLGVSIGHTRSQASTPASEAATTPTVTTVHAGESLWTLARRVAPGHDTRDVVAQIQALNHLSSSTLQAGQVLLLPRAA